MYKHYSTSYLYRKRKNLSEQILSIAPSIIRGSLIETYNSTTPRPRRQGKGAKYYLSVSQKGRRGAKLEYVPQYYKEDVEHYLTNYHRLRDILETICSINREILRRRDRL